MTIHKDTSVRGLVAPGERQFSVIMSRNLKAFRSLKIENLIVGCTLLITESGIATSFYMSSIMLSMQYAMNTIHGVVA